MSENVFQCCYTNTTKNKGATVVSGWDIVACSDGIPSDAIEGCTKFQKGNSSLWRLWRGPTNRDGDPVDADGNVLNLLEIAGDSAYLYLIRSQFGLKDARGRRNMFSHAYILPWSENTLHDPNVFLAISKTNFSRNENETLIERESLLRQAPLTIDKALKIAGIETDGELALFICAVYEQMTNMSVLTPLYVQYDGTDDQLRALLFCLYTFLPLHLRRRLVSASAEGGNFESYNVVFSRDASKHRLYYDSTKDTSNAIPPARASAIERLGFVDYAVRNRSEIDIDQYFDDLERTAKSFNVTSSTTAQVTRAYRLAHTMLKDNDISSYEDERLDLFIDETLRLESHNSDVLDDFLALMLDEVMERPDFELTDVNWQDLTYKLQSAHSAKLDDSARRYNLYRFEQLPAPSAASKLANMANTSQNTFDEYAVSLKDTEKGQEILDAYFANYAIDDSNITWKSLDDILQRSSFVKNREATLTRIEKAASELYCEQLCDIAGVQASLNNYSSLMTLLLKSRDKDSIKKREEFRMHALAKFWDSVNLEAIDPDHSYVYENMSDGSEKACEVLEMLRYYELLVSGGQDEFLREVFEAFPEDARGRKPMSTNEATSSYEFNDRIEHVITLAYGDAEQDLPRWVNLVEKASSDGDEYWLKALFSIRRSIEKCKWEELAEEIRRLEPTVANGRNGDAFCHKTCELVYSELCDIDEIVGTSDDSFASLVPLDVWLTIGDILYPKSNGGPFQIFDRDEYIPAILMSDLVSSDEVVSDSELFEKESYREYARCYIKKKKPKTVVAQKAAVDSWLKAANIRDKESAKNKAPRAAHMADTVTNQNAMFKALGNVIGGVSQRFKRR